jgi:tRNA(Ile)-lysidine synthase
VRIQREATDVPAQLAADWPVATWRDMHVLIAASGGADSLALVRALVELRRSDAGAGRLIVGHVNHQLRGAESDADEAWLRDKCGQLELSFVARRSPMPTGAEASEGALRKLRYRLLEVMADEIGARFVAMAHTRDDQVETVLFRLIRGSGLRGLAGMPRLRPLSDSITVVRPLLACSRADLQSYLRQIGQSWREDATNAAPKYARNRIRLELLPYLREHFNADADAAVLRAAEQADDAQSLIEGLAEKLVERCQAIASPAEIVLQAGPLAGQPDLLTAEALRFLWRRAGWPEQAMTRLWWRELASLAAMGSPASLNLPGNVLARRAEAQIVMRKGDSPPESTQAAAASRRASTDARLA